MEFVGARLGHGVDVGADAVLGHVVIADLDVVGGDGVGRDRRTGIGHAVAVEAERVVLAQAVHGDVVVAVVQARHGNAARARVGDGDARIEARDVVQRTVG